MLKLARTLVPCFAVLVGLLLTPANGAAVTGTWTRQTATGGDPADTFRGLSLRSQTAGFIAGGVANALNPTGTGSNYQLSGTSWALGPAYPTGTPFQFDVSNVDATHAWSVGNNASVEFWNGSTWSAQNSGQPTNGSITLRAVSFVRPLPGIYEGLAVGTAGAILYSNGTTWFDRTCGVPGPSCTHWTTNNLRDVFLLPDGHAWTVGLNGTILYSTDLGQSWTAPVTNPAGGTAAQLFGVQFLDDNNGWVVGATGGQPTPTKSWILHTTDGGVHWTDVTPTGMALSLNAVSFTDANNGWIAANDASPAFNGIVLNTSNGAAATPTWSTTTVVPANGTPSVLFDIQMTDACHGWTAGQNRALASFSCPAPPAPSPTPSPSPGLPPTGAQPAGGTPSPLIPLLAAGLMATVALGVVRRRRARG